MLLCLLLHGPHLMSILRLEKRCKLFSKDSSCVINDGFPPSLDSHAETLTANVMCLGVGPLETVGS